MSEEMMCKCGHPQSSHVIMMGNGASGCVNKLWTDEECPCVKFSEADEFCPKCHQLTSTHWKNTTNGETGCSIFPTSTDVTISNAPTPAAEEHGKLRFIREGIERSIETLKSIPFSEQTFDNALNSLLISIDSYGVVPTDSPSEDMRIARSKWWDAAIHGDTKYLNCHAAFAAGWSARESGGGQA